MNEKVAALVRVKAAVEGKSVSKLISDMIEREMGRSGEGQLETMEEFLQGPLWPLSDDNGRLPSREEVHGERSGELLRRYEHSLYAIDR